MPDPRFFQRRIKLKDFWLFRPAATDLTGRRRAGYWLWNGAVLLAAGICLGMVSLLLAYGNYATAMFKSYFEHPLIAFLNIAPVVVLLLILYGLTGRPWLAFLVSSVVVVGFSLANYYKLRLRDDPVMFEDLKYIREAGSITRTADYNLAGASPLAGPGRPDGGGNSSVCRRGGGLR